MPQPHIVFISGASGAGKTTLIDALKEKYGNHNEVKFFHFDSIGVPSEAGMIKEFGSSKAWQKEKTYRWIKTLLQEGANQKVVILEGQTELTFIEDAFKLYKVKSSTIFLLHAQEDVRHQRLEFKRYQPHLINADMDNWAKYLYKQAQSMGIKILDASHNLNDSVHDIQNLLGGKGIDEKRG